MTAPQPRAARGEAMGEIVADIDATIAHWRAIGVTAIEIGGQLKCRRHWPKIRFKMLAIASGYCEAGRSRVSYEKRLTLTAADRQRLTSARQAAKLPQCTLAFRLGIAESTLRDYEQGRRSPTVGKLDAWRQMLGLAESQQIAA